MTFDCIDNLSIFFANCLSLAPRPAFLRQIEFSSVEMEMDQPMASCSNPGNVTDQQPTSKSLRRRLKKKEMTEFKKDLCHNDRERLKFYSRDVEAKFKRFTSPRRRMINIQKQLDTKITDEDRKTLSLELNSLKRKCNMRFYDYKKAEEKALKARKEFTNALKI